MSIPVTARLDTSVVDALDKAVAAGLAPTRGSIIAMAVGEWLARHGEGAIADSYRRRYESPDPVGDALVEALARFSLASCLASDET